MEKAKKQTTLDDLAGMISRRFDEVDERFDMVEEKADERFKLIIDRFEKVEADVKDIKATLGPLFRMVSMQ